MLGLPCIALHVVWQTVFYAVSAHKSCRVRVGWHSICFACVFCLSLALTVPCHTREVPGGGSGRGHTRAKEAGELGAGQSLHWAYRRAQWTGTRDAFFFLRLRGGATRAADSGNKRSLSPRQTTAPHDIVDGGRTVGSRRGEQVVFPRDCSSLHEAILQCAAADATAASTDEDVDARNGKRGRCEPSASWHIDPPVRKHSNDAVGPAEQQVAGCERRLFVQFGHHEVGDETLLVSTRGTWSICGIGDLSGVVDLALLQALASSFCAASSDTAAPPGKT